MAELLIVVAIMIVLFGVAFIAVINYQRSMALLERDATAKEIFIAAQNHLTTVESQGLLNVSDFGTKDNLPEKDGKPNNGKTYYLVLFQGKCVDGKPGTTDDDDTKGTYGQAMFDLMLPFGSIDETVRLGGNYVIRYQLEPALILDVFYCTESGFPDRFNHTFLQGDDEYSTLLSLRDTAEENHRSERRTYTYNDTSVLGWFGGEEALKLAKSELNAPIIEFHNEEKLYVLISDTNGRLTELGDASLKLFVTGVKSGAQSMIEINLNAATDNPRVSQYDNDGTGIVKYAVVLDDITQKELHFTKLGSPSGTPFIPGENITVHAEAASTSSLAEVKYSLDLTRNSLYSDETSSSIAYVSNIRHLENLDNHISNVKYPTGDPEQDKDIIEFTEARQLADLSWSGFRKNINTIEGKLKNPKSGVPTTPDQVAIYTYESAPLITKPGTFMPVSPSYELHYNGMGHSISNIIVDYDGAQYTDYSAGLFGTLISGSSVTDLVLKDFDIKSRENAGTLAGKVTHTMISNVIARNSTTVKDDAPDDSDFSAASPNVTAGKSAGGLVGLVVGGSIKNTIDDSLSIDGSSINYSAASVYVKSTGGDAGGLIGKTSKANPADSSEDNVTIKGSYSGGHIDNTTGLYSSSNFNVVAEATDKSAGGLIGNMANTTVSSCYSTCSAKGDIAGGFVGTGSGTINYSYCTGLVEGSSKTDRTGIGAFAGTLSGNPSGCSYLSIINYLTDTHEELGPVNNGGTYQGISMIDPSTTGYDTFTKEAPKATALPYAEILNDRYSGKYTFKSISALAQDGSAPPSDAFVTSHYGDWPAPELFVINEPKQP